jgi:hypothetical protein
MAASVPSRDITVEHETEGWMNDPYEYFGYHNTRIHSLPREHVEAVQLAAMNLRLEERRGQIVLRSESKVVIAFGVPELFQWRGSSPSKTSLEKSGRRLYVSTRTYAECLRDSRHRSSRGDGRQPLRN